VQRIVEQVAENQGRAPRVAIDARRRGGFQLNFDPFGLCGSRVAGGYLLQCRIELRSQRDGSCFRLSNSYSGTQSLFSFPALPVHLDGTRGISDNLLEHGQVFHVFLPAFARDPTQSQ